jgi:hypothetical protein
MYRQRALSIVCVCVRVGGGPESFAEIFFPPSLLPTILSLLALQGQAHAAWGGLRCACELIGQLLLAAVQTRAAVSSMLQLLIQVRLFACLSVCLSEYIDCISAVSAVLQCLMQACLSACMLAVGLSLSVCLSVCLSVVSQSVRFFLGAFTSQCVSIFLFCVCVFACLYMHAVRVCSCTYMHMCVCVFVFM